MPGFMTAAQARALYDRAQRRRPRRVTPGLAASLSTMLTGEIRVARESGAVMAAQGHNGPAAFVFAEVRRMGKLRGFYADKSEEENNV